MFALWMRGLKIPNWMEFKTLRPVVIRMNWQTKDNGLDCGIFLMRHMETYMGGGVSNWTAGLHKESVRFDF